MVFTTQKTFARRIEFFPLDLCKTRINSPLKHLHPVQGHKYESFSQKQFAVLGSCDLLPYIVLMPFREYILIILTYYSVSLVLGKATSKM